MLKGFRRLFSSESLLLPIYCYGFVKLLPLSKDIRVKYRLLLFPVQLILAIILLISTLLPLIGFACWREFVHWYLTFKYGCQYHAMLDGSATTIACTRRPIVNSVSAIEAQKSHREMYDFMLEKGALMMKAHPMLRSVIGYELGYHFYKLIDVDVATIIKPLNGYGTNQEFNLLMDDLVSKPMPHNDTFLWEMYVGEVAISWPHDNGPLQIPIVVRYNHLIGDGITVISLITCYFMDDGLEEVRKRCDAFKAAVYKNNKRKLSIKQLIVENVKSYWEFAQRSFVLHSLMNPETQHVLHQGETGTRKITTYGLDSDDGKYLKKIKTIKRRVPNVTFNDIVFTALSASLSDHIDNIKSLGCYKPKDVMFLVPQFIPSWNLDDIIDTHESLPVVKLTNKISASFVKIPICNDAGLLQRLGQIAKENIMVNTSLDIPLLYWQMTVLFALLPFKLVKYCMEWNDGTVLISNVPGYHIQQKSNGCLETDTIIWTINYQKTGITFLLFTHNDRLRLSLLQDCNFIQTREEGQRIIEGFFKYIDQLDDATIK